MTSYRVLIGRDVERGARYEYGHPTWVEAVAFLDEEFREFLAVEDQCPHCLGQAREALTRLRATAEGRPFAAEIDGCDYLIVPPCAPLPLQTPDERINHERHPHLGPAAEITHRDRSALRPGRP